MDVTFSRVEIQFIKEPGNGGHTSPLFAEGKKNPCDMCTVLLYVKVNRNNIGKAEEGKGSVILLPPIVIPNGTPYTPHVTFETGNSIPYGRHCFLIRFCFTGDVVFPNI